MPTELVMLGGVPRHFTSFTELPPLYRGELERSFGNTLLDSRSKPIHRWQGVTRPYGHDELASEVALIEQGLPIDCSGSAFRGLVTPGAVGVVCVLTITNCVYVRSQRYTTNNAVNPHPYEVEYHIEFQERAPTATIP